MSYTRIPVEANTPEWKRARKKGIGASDTPVILGLSEWADVTPWTVYRDKVTDEVHEKDTPYLRWGHYAEHAIRAFLRDEGHVVEDSFGILQSDEHPWLLATLDSEIVECDEDGIEFRVPGELKNVDSFQKDKWTNGPPLNYQAQLQQQLLVMGAPFGYIAAAFGGNDGAVWKLAADHAAQQYIVEKTRQWWERHVVAQVPPEPVLRDNLAHVYPGGEKAIEAEDHIAGAWIELGQIQAQIVPLAEQAKELEFELKRYMENHQSLTYEGETLVTWNPRKGQSRIDKKRLEKERPDIAKECTKQDADTRTFSRKTVEQLETRKAELIRLRQRRAGLRPTG